MQLLPRLQRRVLSRAHLKASLKGTKTTTAVFARDVRQHINISSRQASLVRCTTLQDHCRNDSHIKCRRASSLATSATATSVAASNSARTEPPPQPQYEHLRRDASVRQAISIALPDESFTHQDLFAVFLSERFPEVCAKLEGRGRSDDFASVLKKLYEHFASSVGLVSRGRDAGFAGGQNQPTRRGLVSANLRNYAQQVRRGGNYTATATRADQDARSSVETPSPLSSARRVHIHYGPTNSGKTHHALQALTRSVVGAEAEADAGRGQHQPSVSSWAGIYCAPLRLLAVEKFHQLVGEFEDRCVKCATSVPPQDAEQELRDIEVHLRTGQEKRVVRINRSRTSSSSTPGGLSRSHSPPLKYLSCTTEMYGSAVLAATTAASSFSGSATNYPSQDADVVVLDEAQMLVDPLRGGAWTRVLFAAKCRELHLCGMMSSNCSDSTGRGTASYSFVRRLRALLETECRGDVLASAREYARLSELKVEKDVCRAMRPGDCVICFSRQDVFRVKNELETLFAAEDDPSPELPPQLRAQERAHVTVYPLYGALPASVRQKQATEFNDATATGDDDEQGSFQLPHATTSAAKKFCVLVATDCIGLGVNLRISRVLFSSLHKFDGTERRRLSNSEIKQIAGRAGRGKEDGYVSAFAKEDLEHLRNVLNPPTAATETPDRKPTADHDPISPPGAPQVDDLADHALPIALEVHMLEAFAREIGFGGSCTAELGGDTSSTKEEPAPKFSDLLQLFAEAVRVDRGYRLQDIEPVVALARLCVDPFTGMLPLKDLFLFGSAPCGVNEIELLAGLKDFVQQYWLSGRREIRLVRGRGSFEDARGSGSPRIEGPPAANQSARRGGNDNDDDENQNTSPASLAGEQLHAEQAVSTMGRGAPSSICNDMLMTYYDLQISRDHHEGQGDVDENSALGNMSQNGCGGGEGDHDEASVADVYRLETVHKLCELYLWLANNLGHGSSGPVVRGPAGGAASEGASVAPRSFSETRFPDVEKAECIQSQVAGELYKLLQRRGLRLEKSSTPSGSGIDTETSYSYSVEQAAT